MGFLPFINQGGHRVVRWPRLFCAWFFVIAATLFGACAFGYFLVDDWRYGTFTGLAFGVASAAAITVMGFTTPLDKLPVLPAPKPAAAKEPYWEPRRLFALFSLFSLFAFIRGELWYLGFLCFLSFLWPAHPQPVRR